jgi:hypothetical protein
MIFLAAALSSFLAVAASSLASASGVASGDAARARNFYTWVLTADLIDRLCSRRFSLLRRFFFALLV